MTENNSVKLTFLTESGETKEVIDDKYKPYFLVAYPLTEQDKKNAEYFSGEARVVEKIDLFTNEKRTLAEIRWPNPRIASKAAEKFNRCWENEIPFSRSYIYDKALVFGAPHYKDDLRPVLDVPTQAKDRLETTFREVHLKDPLKHALIEHWFKLLEQPIPASLPQLLNLEVDNRNVYAAWMLARIANIPLAEAISSRRVSDWLKPMIHSYLRRNGILIPTAEELRRGMPTHAVTGALTIAPKAGIYFNTIVCDFESLYPSCIDSFNLSYETVDCAHEECKQNRIPDIESHICQRRRGFYSILVGALKDLRVKIFKPASRDNSLSEEKRKTADATAKLLKLILVSSYGVTVRIHGLACPPMAEAITGYGRYVLRESWRLAEERGLRPLYGDTDSLFLDNVSREQVEWLIRTVKDKFSLDLAIDKQYSLCVLPKAKKAYFGILLDGKADIKGVTAIKSNSPAYITSVFQLCVNELSYVSNQESYEQAKKRIREIVGRATADLKSKRVRIEELKYSVRLYFDPNEKKEEMKTTPQPYQCALQLLEAAKTLNRGDTVSFIKVKPFKFKEKTFTVKPAEFVKNLSEINAEDYVRNLLTALSQTFEPMGIKLEKEKEDTMLKWLSG